MPRPIIVEGPDGSGKSTLINQLSNYTGRAPLHTGGPIHSLSDLSDRLTKIRHAGSNALLDRTPHISEPIYAKPGGRPGFMLEQDLHDHLKLLDPVIIYCRLPHVSDMFRAIDRRKKPHKHTEHLEQVLRDYKAIVDDYDLVMSRLKAKKFTVIGYAWTNYSFSYLQEKLKCAV